MELRVRCRLMAAVVSCWVVAPLGAWAETTLIQFGRQSRWRYHDTATKPKPQWSAADFDASAWAVGAAPLGYGEAELNTTIGFGADAKAKPVTAYFRHRFDVANPQAIAALVFLIRSDDALVVYLNGKEIIRRNLAKGAIGFQTVAAKALDGCEERLYRRFSIPASALVAGRNVVAVEVHQASRASSDLFLDMVLRAYGVGEERRPVLRPQAKRAAQAYHRRHYVPVGMSIPDGYVDGGRGMRIDAAGRAGSRREVIVVDRSRDVFLRKHLQFAKSPALGAMQPIDRAKRLAKYVATEVAPARGGRWALRSSGLLAREYSNRGVLIGEVSRLCGQTVCRHRALLLKLLADEAGLRVALVRGNYNTGQGIGGHAWNELHVAGGGRMIVDTMASPRAAVFASTDAKRGGRYLTVRNKPMYKPTPASQPVGGR